MSGIFGIYHRDGHLVNDETLNSMSLSMTHRGPDGSDIWHDGTIGIGHRMFHTTPESQDEKLPYVDGEAGLVITADARIDNRHELASRTGMGDQLRDSIPDSLLILAAYRNWGEKCVKYLLGDFAFVIWDKRRNHLFCVRDHLGIKPFYYHLSKQIFVFASEVQAILKVRQVPHQINEGRIADYLVPQLEGIDKTTTFYQEIFRLPPAYTMTISKEKKRLTRYWDIDPEYETRLKSDEDYVEAFREIFSNAVHSRLRCNGQPALMLSGGIDSSSIVGITQRHIRDSGKDPLPVFSAVSDNEEQCRETHFIKAVCAFWNIKPLTVCPAELSEYNHEIDSVFDRLADPFDDMTLIMLIYLMARKNDNQVVLDGVEGDIVHSLSPFYPSFLLREGRWLRAMSETLGIWQNHYRKNRPLTDVLIEALRPALVTNALRQWRKRLFSDISQSNALKGTVINRRFAEEVDIKSRLEQLQAQGFQGLSETLRETHIRNVMQSSLTVGIERYERLAAVCSVEARHPLLDKRLVEFSVSLPWDQKVRNGWSKFLLRRTCESLLPNEVVWRKGWDHIGWSLTTAWMQTRYDNIVTEILNQKTILEMYVDHQFFECLKKCDYSASKPDNLSNILDIFILVNWLKKHRQD